MLIACLGAILSALDFSVLFCAVPIALGLKSLRGKKHIQLLAASLVLSAAALGLRVLLDQSLQGDILAFDLFLPLVLIFGTYVLLTSTWPFQYWLRLLLIQFLGMFAVLPLAMNFFLSPEGLKAFRSMLELLPGAGSQVISDADLTTLLRMGLSMLPLVISFMVLGNALLAQWMYVRRTARSWSVVKPLSQFRVPPVLVWGFLLGFAGLVLELVVKLPDTYTMVLLLVAQTFWLLYFIQGLGIVSALLERKKLGRIVLPLLVVLVLTVPYLNVAIVLLLALLGVLELWINFRPSADAIIKGETVK